MGECLFARRGTIHTAPLSLKPTFADNTWGNIARACQKGVVPDTWVVGDQLAMTIDGTDYLVDIIGKNHDVYAEGGGVAPLTFQLHNLYTPQYAMDGDGNKDGWARCDMRLNVLPEILAGMPREVRSAVREVIKKTSQGNQSSVVEETADKLFLLSEIEIFGEATYSFSGEGSRYAYYKSLNVRIKSRVSSTEAEYWSGRSPYKSNTSRYCGVSKSGYANNDSATVAYGVAFAFCF